MYQIKLGDLSFAFCLPLDFLSRMTPRIIRERARASTMEIGSKPGMEIVDVVPVDEVFMSCIEVTNSLLVIAWQAYGEQV